MFLSYSTWGMQTVPIDDAVKHCAALGFDGLELTVCPGWPTDAATMDMAEQRRIRRLYDDHAIELCGLSGNVPLLDEGPASTSDLVAKFQGYLDLASELQRPADRLVVTTTSGGAPNLWESSKQSLVEQIGNMVGHAERAGVMVGIEPHVGAALCRPEQAMWLIDQIRSPALTIHFDISHFNVQGDDMEAIVAQLAPHCGHTHVKDERGRAPNHEFLIPGEGEMDYVRYLKAMQRTGYAGHIVVEISLMVQRRERYDALAAADQSYAVLSRAFQEAGIRRDLAG